MYRNQKILHEISKRCYSLVYDYLHFTIKLTIDHQVCRLRKICNMRGTFCLLHYYETVFYSCVIFCFIFSFLDSLSETTMVL